MKNKESSKSVIKNSFFQKLFGIPSIVWIILSVITKISDNSNSDSLTWYELISANVFLILIWFLITYLISIIVIKFKSRRINNTKYLEQKEDKIVTEIKEKEVSLKSLPKKNKNNENYLYLYEGIIDSYEYKKMAKYFPNRMYWIFVIRGLYLNLIFSAIIAIISKNLISTIIFFIIYQIFIMILFHFRLEHYSEQVFNGRKKKGIVDTEFEIEFYNDYLIKKSETTSVIIKYQDISRCLENDTNFYFEYPHQNMIIIIQKNRCDLELINFIRKNFNNLENHIGDQFKFKGIKKYNHPNFIKNGMLILFIMTIASLWGALYSLELVNQIIPQYGSSFIKNTWVFWCWLPVPILSIILGFKYKNAGFKCTKNIVAGLIIGFLLLIYGSFCMFPTFSEDYSKINLYKKIIDAELPNNGVLEIQNWGTYFDEDKNEYSIINVYYDKENVKELVNSIENSENWILSKEIKSELRFFIPSQLRADDDAYYSIYNKTTSQYNTIPESSNDYEIYTMKYDKSDKHLEIHKFKITYKK